MKKKALIGGAIICSLLVTLSSCHHKDLAVEPPDEVIKDSAKNSTVSSLDMLMANIPQPTAVAKELSKEGVQMNNALLNSPDKASSYSSTFQQAVNMGIYGADLGYISCYNQTQTVMTYFAQVAKMGTNLGLASVFDQKLAALFEGAANRNKDSLSTLVQAAFERAQKELYSNKKATVGTLIFAGGWVEGLYIATNMVKDEKSAKNADLYQRIWDELYAVRYLQQALGDYQKTNADCANMLAMIKPIIDASANLTDDGLKLSDIQSLQTVVSAIRAKLI